VGVVGGQQRGADLLSQAQQVLGDAPFDLQAVVHELDVEELLAEDVLELPGGSQGLVPLAQAQSGLNLRRRAAGGTDEAGSVAGEQLSVDARGLAPLTFQGGEGVHAHEVVQPLVVARQQGHVSVGAAGGDVVAPLGLLAPEDTGLVEAGGARGHVGLHPDDRLDTDGLGGRVELVGTEHVAVVGDRQGGLAQALGLGHVVLDLSGAVQHRVVGVDVEVDEVVLGGRNFLTAHLRHGPILGPCGPSSMGGGQRLCRPKTIVPAGHSRPG